MMRNLHREGQVTTFAGNEQQEPCASSAGKQGASRPDISTVCPRDMVVTKARLTSENVLGVLLGVALERSVSMRAELEMPQMSVRWIAEIVRRM